MRLFNKILRFIFFAVIVRFIVLIVIGLNVRHREKLPQKGPAIIVANHNSHLDTAVLISLFELKLLSRIHPVAAADYFLRNKLIAWFTQNIIGIIAISRDGRKEGVDPLLPCYHALDQNQILILFPEGTRGEPEQMINFKKGIAYIAEKYPSVPVVPVFIHGLGKALPRGEGLLVPFFCDLYIGDSLYWNDNHNTFMAKLNDAIQSLAGEDHFEAWE